MKYCQKCLRDHGSGDICRRPRLLPSCRLRPRHHQTSRLQQEDRTGKQAMVKLSAKIVIFCQKIVESHIFRKKSKNRIEKAKSCLSDFGMTDIQ